MKIEKIFTFIKRLIIGIIGVAFFAFAIAITILLLNLNDYGVTKIDDTSFVIIKNKMAYDSYEKGDLVLVKEKSISEIEIGDEVFIYRITKTTNGKNKVNIDLGIVGSIHEEDGAISFDTGETYSMEFVIGKADVTYNKVGTYLGLVQSTWGFLFIVLVPSFLIFIYELYALIVEIKYGGKEEKLEADTEKK